MTEARRAGPPMWLLAELTYACPLQCPYCSNPLDMHQSGEELSTEAWMRVLQQARALGSVQLGLSGGEPLLRRDLEDIIGEARRLGYYSNLITSGAGLDAQRLQALQKQGLDHVQLSFQAATDEINDMLAGTESFQHKLAMAQAIKACGYPMVLCFVLHRHNIDQIEHILELADRLEADYVELATTQYYGWAWLNRDALLPTKAQLERGEQKVAAFRARQTRPMQTYYVVPDYYNDRPKACMNGWGHVFLTIAPDGTALPCHAARQLPMTFPTVHEHDIEHIWYHSDAFNHFRGEDWMREPCRSCDERERDFGGCRCQAYLLTGDARNADPVCSKSPHRPVVDEIIANAAKGEEKPLVFRNMRNARALS